MSEYLYAKSCFDPPLWSQADTALPIAGESLRSNLAADRAIDAALRNVSLPEGLMKRLGRLADFLPDESADRVDYLEC